MNLNKSSKHKLTRWLAIFLVGFMLIWPFSPIFVLAEEDDSGLSQETIDLATGDIDSLIETIQNDPVSAYQDIFGKELGPDNSDEEVATETNNDSSTDSTSSPKAGSGQDNDGIPDEADLGPDNSDDLELQDELVKKDNNEDNNDTQDDLDGIPNEEDLGPEPGSIANTQDNESEEVPDNNSDPSTGSEQAGSGGSGYSAPRLDRQDINDIIESLPRNSEEAEEYRREHFDEQEVTTDNVDESASTETTTAITTPTTSAGSDLGEDTDDTTVVSESKNTDTIDVGSDNTLQQDNITSGSAVSGDNLMESGKDVLEGTITTGDAGITSEGKVQGNTSSVSTGSSSGGGGSGWTQRIYGSAGNSNAGDDNTQIASVSEVKELTVVNKNLAFVSNIKELLAKSGGNRISALQRFKEGGIYTGTSRAKSSLLNIINTNTVDSAFLPLTFDIFDNFTGNLNILEILFEAFGANLDGEGAITATAVNNNEGDNSNQFAQAIVDENINISNENEGYIFNDLDMASISGQNQILAGNKAKELEINTGRVDITNNLISFLNSNLFQSKIGVVVINVFSDWMGNLILPGASQFAGSIPNPTGAVASTAGSMENSDNSLNNAIAVVNTDLEHVNDNQGAVQTEILINANTGENYAIFDKRATNININSGQVKTMSNMLTLANRDIIGTAFSHGFFNILGDWTGALVGRPQSSRMTGSNRSFVVTDEDAALSGPGVIAHAENNSSGADDSNQTAIAKVNRSIKINNKNEGAVVNRLNILGDSGNNDVASYKGRDIDINTGDVGVANNISTFLNNNFSFSKGLTVALNVFGKWKGNIAYDELQDLGAFVDLLSDEDELQPGKEVVYEVKAVNMGTEPTEADTLSFTYDSSRLELVSADGGIVSGNTISWPIPELQSADSRIFKPVFRIRDLSAGAYIIEALGQLNNSDQNQENNSDVEQLSLNVNSSGYIDNSGSDSDSSGSDGSDDNSSVEIAAGNDNPSTGSGQAGSGGSNNNPPSSRSGGGFTPGYLLVKKTNEGPGPYGPEDAVNYIITVQNPGDTPVRDVVVYDVLKNGTIESDASWPLQDVAKGETITIEYEIVLKEEAESGPYTNTAYASGFDNANAVIRSNIVSTTIQVENPLADSTSSPQTGSGQVPSGSTSSWQDDPIFGVIDEFNPGATSTAVITRSGDNDGLNSGNYANEYANSSNEFANNLSSKKIEAQEDDYEDQMSQTSSVSRYIPIAKAFEAPEIVINDSINGKVDGKVLSASAKKLARSSVYPNFLHFDGMPDKETKNSGSGWLDGWLVWILIVFVLITGYISYKEKNKRRIL